MKNQRCRVKDYLIGTFQLENPMTKLQRRRRFDSDLAYIRRYNVDNLLNETDLFAIFDAVIRRGGFNKVTQQNRWDEVSSSLDYYAFTEEDLKTIYNEQLLQIENSIGKKATQMIEDKAIQKYPLPRVWFFAESRQRISHVLHYEELKFFEKEQFGYLDVFLCFRSIALCHGNHFKKKSFDETQWENFDFNKLTNQLLDDNWKELMYKTYCFYIASGSMLKEKADVLIPRLISERNTQVIVTGVSLANCILCLELLRQGFLVTLSYFPHQERNQFEELCELSPSLMWNEQIEKLTQMGMHFQQMDQLEAFYTQTGRFIDSRGTKQGTTQVGEILKKMLKSKQKNQETVRSCIIKKKAKGQYIEEENTIIEAFITQLITLQILPQSSVQLFKSAIKNRLLSNEQPMQNVWLCLAGCQELCMRQLRTFTRFHFIDSSICRISQSKRNLSQFEAQFANGLAQETHQIVFQPTVQDLSNERIGSLEINIPFDYKSKLKVFKDQFKTTTQAKFVMEFSAKFWKYQRFTCQLPKNKIFFKESTRTSLFSSQDAFFSVVFFDITPLRPSSNTFFLMCLFDSYLLQSDRDSLISAIKQTLEYFGGWIQKQLIAEKLLIASAFQFDHIQEAAKDYSTNPKINSYDLSLAKGIYVNPCVLQGISSGRLEAFLMNSSIILKSMILEEDSNKTAENDAESSITFRKRKRSSISDEEDEDDDSSCSDESGIMIKKKNHMINLENKVVSAQNSSSKKSKKKEAIVIDLSETDSVNKITNEDQEPQQYCKVEDFNNSNEDLEPAQNINSNILNRNINSTILRQPNIQFLDQPHLLQLAQQQQELQEYEMNQLIEDIPVFQVKKPEFLNIPNDSRNIDEIEYLPFKPHLLKLNSHVANNDEQPISVREIANKFCITSQQLLAFNRFAYQLTQSQRSFPKQCLELFELHNPIEISKNNKIILKFGLPTYINNLEQQHQQSEISLNQDENNKNNKVIAFNDGFMSACKLPSLLSPLRQTAYLLAGIYIKEFQTYYFIIISADNPSFFLLNENLYDLILSFQSKIKKAAEQQQTLAQNFPCYDDHLDMKTVFNNLNYQLLYSSILESLLGKTSGSKLEKKLISENIEAIWILSIEKFFKRQKQLYGLPEDLTIGDIFFGYYDAKIHLLLNLGKDLPTLHRECTGELSYLYQKSQLSRKNYLSQEKVSTDSPAPQSIPVPIAYMAHRYFLDLKRPYYECGYQLEVKSIKQRGQVKKNQIRKNQQKWFFQAYDKIEQLNSSTSGNGNNSSNNKREFDSAQECFDSLLFSLIPKFNLSWLSEYLFSFLLSELRAMKKCPKSIRFLSKLYAKNDAINQQSKYNTSPQHGDQIQDTHNKSEKNNIVNGKSQVQLRQEYLDGLKITSAEKAKALQIMEDNPERYYFIESEDNNNEHFLVTTEQTYDFAPLQRAFNQDHPEVLEMQIEEDQIRVNAEKRFQFAETINLESDEEVIEEQQIIEQ